jgi:hypothetical protein
MALRYCFVMCLSMSRICMNHSWYAVIALVLQWSRRRKIVFVFVRCGERGNERLRSVFVALLMVERSTWSFSWS